MTHVYIVEREGGDGIETDVFTSYELAKEWEAVCAGHLRIETVWNRAFLDEMKESYQNAEEVNS